MHLSETTIHDYLDDELLEPASREVERHLEACEECRRWHAELEMLRRAIASLEPLDPPAFAWTRIASALARGSAPRRLQWALVGAAAGLVVATAIGLRLGLSPVRGAPNGRNTPKVGQPAAAGGPASPSAATRELTRSAEEELDQAEAHYRAAIAKLGQIERSEQGALDPETAATLEKNLAVLDRAIAESQDALASQPGSEPARQSLLDGFNTKVALLQDTVALIGEMRTGEEAGAARRNSERARP